MAALYALNYYTNAVYGGYADTDSYLNSNGAGGEPLWNTELYNVCHGRGRF